MSNGAVADHVLCTSNAAKCGGYAFNGAEFQQVEEVPLYKGGGLGKSA